MDRTEIIARLQFINASSLIPHSIGCVYSLNCQGEDPYYGKTFTSLKTRARSHEQNYEKYKKDSKLMFASTVLLIKNKPCTMHIMSILPIYDDNDKTRLLKEEQEFISENNCVNTWAQDEAQDIEDGGDDEDGGDNEDEETIHTPSPSINIPLHIACVYSIYDDIGTYIGSTMQALSYRIKGHERDALKLLDPSSNLDRICSSNEIILRSNYDFKVLEWVAVESIKELRLKEREWIEKTENCVNKNIPIRSPEEVKQYHHDYYVSHKDDPVSIEKRKKYMLDNKERIRINHQRWNKENKEKMREYYSQRYHSKKHCPFYLENRKKHKVKYNQSEKGKAAIRAYYNNSEVKEHRSQMHQQKKETETEEHKLNRKQKAKEWKSKIVVCCGKEMTQGYLSEHQKTQLHIKNNPS
jgi:hypothetical protein